MSYFAKKVSPDTLSSLFALLFSNGRTQVACRFSVACGTVLSYATLRDRWLLIKTLRKGRRNQLLRNIDVETWHACWLFLFLFLLSGILVKVSSTPSLLSPPFLHTNFSILSKSWLQTKSFQWSKEHIITRMNERIVLQRNRSAIFIAVLNMFSLVKLCQFCEI